MTYYYLCAFFTLISTGVSLGFSIAAWLKAKVAGEMALQNAKYAISRSLALFLVTLGSFAKHAKSVLLVLAMIMVFVQLFDGIIGLKVSLFKTVGPITTAILNLLLLILYLFKG